MNDFCLKYNLQKTSIEVSKSKGQISKDAFYKPNRGTYEVHESYFIRRAEFKKHVKNYSQSMYYYLSEFFNDAQIIESINKETGVSKATLRTYFSSRLFAIDYSSILNIRIACVEWKLYKYYKKIERILNKVMWYHRKKGKFKVEYTLDLRMNKENQCLRS